MYVATANATLIKEKDEQLNKPTRHHFLKG